MQNYIEAYHDELDEALERLQQLLEACEAAKLIIDDELHNAHNYDYTYKSNNYVIEKLQKVTDLLEAAIQAAKGE